MQGTRARPAERCAGGSRAPRRRRLGALVAALLLLVVRTAAAQAVAPPGRYDPALRFRTISTARFDIHFHQGAEALAARLAGFVEAEAGRVDARFGRPGGRVQVVLVDQTDVSNGWATVVPYNLIEIAAVPPASLSPIGNTTDWLRLVFAHEYTHVVHLERGRGWIGGLRRAFGRMPLLYPNVFLPEWQVEGIATYTESAATAEGRIPAGDFRMLIAEGAGAGPFLRLDQASGGLVDWPAGHASYLYGGYFHEYLARRYGPESIRRLTDRTAGMLPFFGARAYRGVFGRPLGRLWQDFEADVRARTAPGAGEHTGRRLTRHGFLVAAPLFAPDGRLLYSVANPHGFPALMELSPGGAVRRVTPRYRGERAAIAGTEVVFHQLDVVRHTDLQSDLYASPVAGGNARRLTRGARAADPDVAPDGRTIVCTVQESGRRFLATMPLPPRGQTGRPLPLLSEASVEYSWPRWSPDGTRIAAERRMLGHGSAIVIVDPLTQEARTLVPAGAGRNTTPMWLPGGEALIFASDREGPFGLYRVDVATGAVRKLHGTGAAHSPALSPDRRRLVYVGYSAAGYDLYEIDAAAIWSDVTPRPAAAGTPAGDAAPVAAGTSPPAASPAPGDGVRYRPWATLAPRLWVPWIETRGDDLVVGGATAGFDALGRHAYFASGGWAFPRRRPDWQLDYTYRRWRPALVLSASDTVDHWRTGTVRSREGTTGVLLPFRRVRWNSTAFAGLHAARELFDCPSCAPPVDAARSRADLRFGWQGATARRFGYSISPEEGGTVTVTSEFSRRMEGTSGRAGAATADVRAYRRAFPRHAVLAIRTAGAAAWGDRAVRRVFEAGGSGSQRAGFEYGTGAIALVRGYRARDLFGSRAMVANLEYRFPLAWPQRGVGTLPLMVRSLHGAVFADAGHAWEGRLRTGRIRRSFGAELSLDTILGYSVPVTLTAGAAWRQDPSGRRRGWAVFTRASP